MPKNELANKEICLFVESCKLLTVTWETDIPTMFNELKRDESRRPRGWMTRPSTTHMKNYRHLTALRREQRKKKEK